MSNATLTITPPETETEIKPRVEVDGHDPSVLISMRNIWKTYQMGTESVHALHGVSFDIPRGEYIAIIGPSGSGKSTLMNLIGCLELQHRVNTGSTARTFPRWTTTNSPASAIRKWASFFRLSIYSRGPLRFTTSNCR